MLAARLAWLRTPTVVSRLGGIISLGAILGLGVFAVRTDWRALLQPLETLRLAPFGAAVLLALGVEVVKTLRWQLLLDAPLARLPRLLGVMFTGRVLNAL